MLTASADGCCAVCKTTYIHTHIQAYIYTQIAACTPQVPMAAVLSVRPHTYIHTYIQAYIYTQIAAFSPQVLIAAVLSGCSTGK